jgi:hypothetical protein
MFKKILFLLFTLYSIASYGQDIDVKGRVLDDSNIPLPGVSVTIKGTTRGSLTDINGNYSIKASGGQILVFSFLGMETKEVSYNNQATLDVILTTDKKALEEVVVIGYQTVKKADLTGAVAVFNPTE